MSVAALHVGAAISIVCLPDLESSTSETSIEQQAFHSESVKALNIIMMKDGFKESEVDVEVLVSVCAIIRAIKDE